MTARTCWCGICSACVGLVRDDLTTIVTLDTHLLAEAAHRGINSEAAMLAGPAADYRDWRNLRAATINRDTCRCGDRCPALAEGDDWKPCPDVLAFTEDNRDELHPLWVLGTWDMLVAEHYGHQARVCRITVESAAAYLSANLTELARDPKFPFVDLATEVHDCRAHLEDVLRDGERVETSEAPCPMCGAARLVKEHGTQVADDRWRCPRCRASYTEHDYRAKVEAVYVLHADRLTASQISETYRVPEPTVRRWASGHDPTVRVYPKDGHGRQLYDVTDVLAMRDTATA